MIIYTPQSKNGFRKESADLHCKESINKNIHRLETFFKISSLLLVGKSSFLAASAPWLLKTPTVSHCEQH